MECSQHSVKIKLGKFSFKARGLLAIICLTAVAFVYLGLAGLLGGWLP